MIINKTFILVTLFILAGIKVSAQHTPLTPISNKVFTPFMINPAIAGSKDFMAIDLAATIQGDDYSQMLSTNTRVAKKGPRYFGAPVSRSFTNIGIGGALYNDHLSPSRNLGVSLATSYHLPLNEEKISFISGGVVDDQRQAARAVRHTRPAQLRRAIFTAAGKPRRDGLPVFKRGRRKGESIHRHAS